VLKLKRSLATFFHLVRNDPPRAQEFFRTLDKLLIALNSVLKL
jgi:hypothetical protein